MRAAPTYRRSRANLKLPGYSTHSAVSMKRASAAAKLCRIKRATMYTARERFDRLRDDGVNAPEMISPIKCDSCGKAPEIARAARDMHGGNGIFMAYGAMRHC